MERLLSPNILSAASLSGNEYAWKPADVVAAIEDARQRGLETIGGQAQFRFPDGTCELYWVTVDPSERRMNEPWDDWVSRSADEAIAAFRRQMALTDWTAEAQAWDFLREKAESGIDLIAHLCFVIYFGENPLRQSVAG